MSFVDDALRTVTDRLRYTKEEERRRFVLSENDYGLNPAFRAVLRSEFENMSGPDRVRYIAEKRSLARKMFPLDSLVELSAGVINSGLNFSTAPTSGLDQDLISQGLFVVENVDSEGDVWIHPEGNPDDTIYVDPCCLFPYGGIPDTVDVCDDGADFFAGF